MKTRTILSFVLATGMLAAPVITTQEASARRTTQTYKKKSRKKARSRYSNSQQSVSVLQIFSNNVGKYPYEINLLRNKALRTRLVKLMGEKDFLELQRNFNVVGPIEKDGNIYSVFGGQTHNAGCTNATITYDSANNVLTVITKRDCAAEQVYAEN